MEARIPTRGDGYCRPPDPENRRGALPGAPRTDFLKRCGSKFSRPEAREVRAPVS